MALLQVIHCQLSAQESADSTYYKPKIGLFGNYNYNIHSANFQELPGVPNCCPRFEKGTGTGISIGALYEYPLRTYLAAQIRAGYKDIGGILTATETELMSVNGTPQQGEFTHTLTASLGLLSLEPMITVRYLGLTVNAGLNLGFLMVKNYSQKEEVTKPAGYVTFLDSNGNDTHSRIRNQLSGAIPGVNAMQFGISAGIGYDLPLNARQNLLLSPEVYYTLPLTNIGSSIPWKVSVIQGGLALKYIFLPPPPKPKPIDKYENIDKIDTVRSLAQSMSLRDSIIIGRTSVVSTIIDQDSVIIHLETSQRTDTLLSARKILLSGDITALGVDDDGTEHPSPKFIVEEFPYLQLVPLLTYVFFDEANPAIPDKYKKVSKAERGKFDENKLYHLSTVETYYYLLNIIGKRMLDNKSAEINITGCNSDQASEKGNKELSNQRANAVANYLHDVWDIPMERMKVTARNLPAKCTNPPGESDSQQENRRVEITSADYEITKPVFTSDTLRTVNPPILRIRTTYQSEGGLKDWEINIGQTNVVNKTFSGKADLPSIIDWRFENEQEKIPRQEEPLAYELLLNDIPGQHFATPKNYANIEQITIRKKQNSRMLDKTIDHYSLILFDFDKSDVSADNMKFIKIIKDRLKANSLITVMGYTDRTGNSDYNTTLSEKRALNVSKTLGQNVFEVKGTGSEKLLHNNDLPEGRFYSRTVEIKVETPIER